MSTKRNVYDILLEGLCIALLIVMFCIAMMFESCSPTQRMTRIAVKHPGAAAVVMSRLYPVQVQESTTTQYVPGAVEFVHDTVTVDCGLLDLAFADGSCEKKTGRTIRVPCPPSTRRVDTVVKYVSRTVKDTKEVTAIASELAGAKTDKTTLTISRNTWRTWCIALAVLLLASLVGIGFLVSKKAGWASILQTVISFAMKLFNKKTKNTL